jgi:hypothetical protein
VAHAALVVAHGSARDVHGFEGSRMGGVGGRLEPCEGHRWLRCALKRHGQFCCGTRSRSHTRGQRAVHAWWWGGGIDVVHERGSGIIGIFVVLRRHTWSQRHTCGHRAATCGPRGALGAIHVWPHTHGEGCTSDETRERSQRAERCVEKYRCILRICASRRAISRLYMYTRSGGREATGRGEVHGIDFDRRG